MTLMQQCEHLGNLICDSVSTKGTRRVIYQCAKRSICTLDELGITLASGNEMACCAVCPLHTGIAERQEALAQAKHRDDVAAIIPCNNYGKYLAQCLSSVMSQTHRPAEVVVVDDAGDDAALVKRLCDQHGAKYIRVEHRHVYLARKAGLDNTVSPYIVFLDANDFLGSDYLSECLSIMQADHNIAIVTSDLQRFGLSSETVHHTDVNIERDNWIHSGSMVRRSALTASAAYERPAPPTQSHADWYVWRILVRAGWRVGRVRKANYYYRQHGANMLLGAKSDATYYDKAALGLEPITLVLALSGRERYWARLSAWVQQQSRVTDVLVIDSSGSTAFGSMVKVWLASLDMLSAKYVKIAALPGLADRDRWSDKSAYYSVQDTMPRIYGPMREAVTTEYMMIVEDDVLPPPNAIEALLRNMGRDVAAVSGVVPSRFNTGMAIARAEMSSPGLKLGGSGVQPIAASGFGCLLLRRSALLDGPPFNSGGCGDYDTEFCKAVTATGWTWLLDWGVVAIHGEATASLTLLPADQDPGLAPWERAYLSGSLPDCSHRATRQGAVMCNLGCPSMQTEPVSVFGCTKHGQVTLGRRRSDIKHCLECSDCDELVQLTSTTV